MILNAVPIRVVIADDNPRYRASLRIVITLDGDIDVVGEAGNGYEAVDLAVSTHPDVIVIDNRMPRLGGIDATRAITAQTANTRVLMLTMSDDDDHLSAAVHAGVSGYVYKDASGEAVAEAIRAVHAGARPLPPHVPSWMGPQLR